MPDTCDSEVINNPSLGHRLPVQVSVCDCHIPRTHLTVPKGCEVAISALYWSYPSWGWGPKLCGPICKLVGVARSLPLLRASLHNPKLCRDNRRVPGTLKTVSSPEVVSLLADCGVPSDLVSGIFPWMHRHAQSLVCIRLKYWTTASQSCHLWLQDEARKDFIFLFRCAYSEIGETGLSKIPSAD